MKLFNQITKEKQQFNVDFQLLNVVLQTNTAWQQPSVTLKLAFKRGEFSYLTKPVTVQLTNEPKDYIVNFIGESFQKECSFFYNKSAKKQLEPESKKPNIRVLLTKEKKDELAADSDIDLTIHFGKANEHGTAKLSMYPNVEKQGLRVKTVTYICAISCQKPKHEELYKSFEAQSAKMQAILKQEQNRELLERQTKQQLAALTQSQVSIRSALMQGRMNLLNSSDRSERGARASLRKDSDEDSFGNYDITKRNRTMALTDDELGNYMRDRTMAFIDDEDFDYRDRPEALSSSQPTENQRLANVRKIIEEEGEEEQVDVFQDDDSHEEQTELTEQDNEIEELKQEIAKLQATVEQNKRNKQTAVEAAEKCVALQNEIALAHSQSSDSEEQRAIELETIRQQISQVSNEIENKQHENQEEELKLQHINNQLAELNEQIATLQNIARCRNEIQSLAAERANEAVELDSLKKQTENLQIQLIMLRANETQIATSNQQSASQYAQLLQSHAHNERTASNLETQGKQLLKQLKTHSLQVLEKQALLTQAKEDQNQLDAEQTELNHALNQQLIEINANKHKLESKIHAGQDLTNVINNLQAYMTELDEVIQQSEKEKLDLEKTADEQADLDIASLRSQIAEASKRIDEGKENQTRLVALKSECDIFEASIIQMQAEVKLEESVHEQEKKETNNQLISIESEVSKLIQENEKLENGLKQFKEKFNDADTDTACLKHEIDKSNSEQSDLLQTLTQLRAELKTEQDTNQYVFKQLTSIKDVSQSLDQNIAALSAQIAATSTNNVDSSQVGQLERILNMLAGKLVPVVDELNERKAEQDQAEEEKKQLEHEQDNLLSLQTNLLHQVSEQQQQLSVLAQQEEQMMVQLTNMQAYVNEVDEVIEMSEEELAQKWNDVNAMHDQAIEELRCQIAEAKQTLRINEEANNQLNHLREECISLENELHRGESETQRVEMESEKELESIQLEINDTTTQLNYITEDIERVGLELQPINDQLLEIDEEVVALQKCLMFCSGEIAVLAQDQQQLKVELESEANETNAASQELLLLRQTSNDLDQSNRSLVNDINKLQVSQADNITQVGLLELKAKSISEDELLIAAKLTQAEQENQLEQEQLSQIARENKELVEKADCLQQQMSANKETLDQLKRAGDELQNQLQNVSAYILEVEQVILKSEKEKHDMIMHIEKTAEEQANQEIESLRGQITEIQQLLTQRDIAQNRLVTLNSECQVLESDLARLKEENVQTGNTHQEELEPMQAAISQLALELEVVTVENNKIEADLQEPRSLIAQADNEIETVRSEIAAFDKELQANERHTAEMQQMFQSMLNDLQMAEVELNHQRELQVQMTQQETQLNEQLEDVSIQNSETIEQLFRFEEEAKDLERQAEASVVQIAIKQAEIAKAREQKANLLSQQEELSEVAKTLTKQTDKAKETLEQLNAKNYSLADVLAKMGSYTTELEETITSSISERDSLRQQLEQIEKQNKEREIEDLKRQVLELQAAKRREVESQRELAIKQQQENENRKRELNEQFMQAQQEHFRQFEELEHKLTVDAYASEYESPDKDPSKRSILYQEDPSLAMADHSQDVGFDFKNNQGRKSIERQYESDILQLSHMSEEEVVVEEYEADRFSLTEAQLTRKTFGRSMIQSVVETHSDIRDNAIKVVLGPSFVSGRGTFINENLMDSSPDESQELKADEKISDNKEFIESAQDLQSTEVFRFNAPDATEQASKKDPQFSSSFDVSITQVTQSIKVNQNSLDPARRDNHMILQTIDLTSHKQIMGDNQEGEKQTAIESQDRGSCEVAISGNIGAIRHEGLANNHLASFETIPENSRSSQEQEPHEALASRKREVYGAVGPNELSRSAKQGSVQIAQRLSPSDRNEETKCKSPIVPSVVVQEIRRALPSELSDASFQERGSFYRNSVFNKSGQSLIGLGRDCYRATLFDKQGGSSRLSKQAKVDLIVRDLYLSVVSKRDLFSVTSDYETMEGFQVFQKMLSVDQQSHEAMFGLGQLNFKIKRYETAEYWFAKACSVHKDIAYRFWLGLTYFKLYELLAETNPKKAKFASYAAKNLQRCADQETCQKYALFVLLHLAASVKKSFSNPVKIEELNPLIYYTMSISELGIKSMSNLAQAFYIFETEDASQRSVWLQVLNMQIQQEPQSPETYLVVISHHLEAAARLEDQSEEAKHELEQAVLTCELLHQNVVIFSSLPEKLLSVTLYAKSLLKAGQTMKALFVLQEQFVQTPHYIGLLYLYAKYIIKARVKELLSTAIGALSEVIKHGVGKRRHNAFFYLGLAQQQLGFVESASLHFGLYMMGGSVRQLSEKIGPLKRFSKEAYVAQFEQSGVLTPEHRASIQAARTISESFPSKYKTGDLLAQNHLASPLDVACSVMNTSQPENKTEAELLQLATLINNKADKIIMKAKIVVLFSKDKPTQAFTEMTKKLLASLTNINIDGQSPQEIQISIAKHHALIKLLLARNKLEAQIDQPQHVLSVLADRLLLLVEKFSQTESIPSNHWAKLIKSAARCYYLGYKAQQSTSQLILVVTTMLRLKQVMPAIDQTLANPRLPADIDSLLIPELEYLDFFLQTNNATQVERGTKESVLFKESKWFKQRLQLGTAHENAIQEIEDLVVQGNTDYLQRRSTTPLITMFKIVKEYLPDNDRLPQDLSQVQTVDRSFAVYSNPSYLKEVAIFCLDANYFPDLALQCLKDYISSLTYYKEFHPQVDLSLAKKQVVIAMSRCLTRMGAISLSQQFLTDAEKSLASHKGLLQSELAIAKQELLSAAMTK